MRSTQSESFEDPDSVDTIPARARTHADVDAAYLNSTAHLSSGWDSEAPTAVNVRRPVFSPPPRLPTT